MDASRPRDIGSRLELFVDEWLIDRMNGIALKMQQPVPREVVMEYDRPWEGPVSLPGMVMADDGKFKTWYGARSSGGASGQSQNSHTAYAESQDGIHWERPMLGLTEIDGSSENNVIRFVDTNDTHMGGIYRDERPGVGSDERFKAMTVRKIGTNIRESGHHIIRGFTSADGLSWRVLDKDPLLVGGTAREYPSNMFDGEASFFWDSLKGEYVGYFRGWEPSRGGTYSDLGGGVRSIRMATSPDFREWSDMTFIDMGDSPQEHLYKHTCAPYFRAPHIYLMFPWRFVPQRKLDPEWDDKGISETVFMTSRDGVHFERRFMEALIRPGPDPRNWTDRNMMMTKGMLETAPGELSVYYGENYKRPTCRARRATYRTDGFVSVHAGYGGGELVTRPLTFSGDELVMNFSTSAVGSVRAEIQDADGRPIKGYELHRSSEIFGDAIEQVVSWGDATDVGALAGSPVRLRFVMKDSDLYSIRFRRRAAA